MFRLIATVRGGTNNSPQTARTFATVEEARTAAKALMHANNRVTRVMIVREDAPQPFVEWIERG